MSHAIGIDLGGTKIEAQVFGDDWTVRDRRRISTPRDYAALVDALTELADWATGVAGGATPLGVSAAGLVAPATGLALTANLPASGRPLPTDIEGRVGQPVTYINDCRALTLSEAVFGAARGVNSVAGLVIGTGVGGGFAVGGALAPDATGMGGEYGHLPAPADILMRHDLPLARCGCGRLGCIETYLAGPGMTRIAQQLGHGALAPAEIAAGRTADADLARVWAIWLEFLVSLCRTITLVSGPDAIVIAGGLSKISGLTEALAARAAQDHWNGFSPPRFLIAEGGDASGARGAAFAAYLEERENRAVAAVE